MPHKGIMISFEAFIAIMIATTAFMLISFRTSILFNYGKRGYCGEQDYEFYTRLTPASCHLGTTTYTFPAIATILPAPLATDEL